MTSLVYLQRAFDVCTQMIFSDEDVHMYRVVNLDLNQLSVPLTFVVYFPPHYPPPLEPLHLVLLSFYFLVLAFKSDLGTI